MPVSTTGVPPSLTNTLALALTVYGEARGESLLGQLAVASVIDNRRKDGRWGASFLSVVLAPRQFSCWNETDPNRATLLRIADQMSTPEGQVSLQKDRIWHRCLWIADGVMRQLVPSPVAGATHYFSTSLPVPPTWARTGRFIQKIDAHLFYDSVR